MAYSKNPISLLQEVFAQQNKALPTYKELPSDSNYPFKCGVVIENTTAYGYGSTKKEAKTKCAEEALLKLGVGSANQFKTVIPPTLAERPNNINYIGQLHEQAASVKVPNPVYCDKFPKNGLFVVECQYLNMTTEGVSPTKKEAKQQASKAMLEKLGNNNIDYKQHQRLFNPEEDQEKINQALKMYAKLCVTNEEPSGPENVLGNDPDIVLPECETSDDITLDELIAKLEARGHKCKLTQKSHKSPYWVVLLIDDCASAVMGVGNTLEAAHNDLLYFCKLMYNDGFSFKPYFKNCNAD